MPPFAMSSPWVQRHSLGLAPRRRVATQPKKVKTKIKTTSSPPVHLAVAKVERAVKVVKEVKVVAKEARVKGKGKEARVLSRLFMSRKMPVALPTERPSSSSCWDASPKVPLSLFEKTNM